MEMFPQEYLQHARDVYHSVLEDYKRMFGRVEASPASRNWDDEYGATYHNDPIVSFVDNPGLVVWGQKDSQRIFEQTDINWVKEGF